MAARTTNAPRQEVRRSSCPPAIGARIGARPLISMVRARKRATSLPS